MGVHCSCTCFILAFLFLILPTPFSSPLFQKNISGTWETTKLSKLKVIYVSKSLCTFSSQSTLNSHKFDFIMVDFFGGRIWYCYVDFVVVRLLDPWGHVSTKYPPVCQFLCLYVYLVLFSRTLMKIWKWSCYWLFWPTSSLNVIFQVSWKIGLWNLSVLLEVTGT